MLTNILFRNPDETSAADLSLVIEDEVVHECLRDPSLVKMVDLTKFSIDNVYKLYVVSKIGKPYAITQLISTTRYSGYNYQSVFDRYVARINERQSWFNLNDNQAFRQCMTYGYKSEQSELICLCYMLQVLNLARQVPFTIFDREESRVFNFLFKGTGSLYGEDKAIVGAIRARGFIASPNQDQIKLAYLHLAQTIETLKFLQGVC
ncbi:MAG: hypothetical protein E6Q33_07415 [Neisseriales bacterium]|nr:MAG: hypothetical protein E6Q33_07415 [Neisseriales bacterium]